VRGILGSLLVLIAPLAAVAQQRGAPQQLPQPRSAPPRPASPSATAALAPIDPFPPPAPAVNDLRSGAWQQHRSLVDWMGPEHSYCFRCLGPGRPLTAWQRLCLHAHTGHDKLAPPARHHPSQVWAEPLR